MQRPIRFLTGGGRVREPARLLAAARLAEEVGYSTFGMADHFMMPFAPLIALQAIADATSTLRVTQVVLVQHFRHPAVLAKELASLDVFSGGRLEIGIGAGWMQAEFEQAGMAFDRASVRIERLEEAVAVLKGLFADGPFKFSGNHFTITALDGSPKPIQRPYPPIMIGGGGPKILAAAARHADILQVLPGSARADRSAGTDALSAEAFQDKIDLIRKESGARFDEIELGTQLMNITITDDADRALAELTATYRSQSSGRVDAETLLRSPVVAIGTLDEVCDKLLETRETFGLSYFSAPVGARPESLAPVIQRLRDR